MPSQRTRASETGPGLPLPRRGSADPAPGTFSPLSRLPFWLRDLLAVLLVLGPGFAGTDFSGTVFSSPAAAVLVAASAGSMLLRRRAPLVGASVAVVACVLGLAVDGPIVSYLLAVLVGVFSVAARMPRRTSLLFSGCTVVLLAAATLAFLDSSWHDARAMLQLAAFVGFATAAGDANRSHAAYIRGITERARRAEETKESEALRRVAEERLRIARDLHDLLAHQIAVINLHSSVASQALPDRPDDAETSLATIRAAARTVLGEIGSLLNVLRATDAGGTGLASAPVAGLADLEPLLIDFERSGLRVEHRLAGTPRPLPGAVDMVAFRVVQEALTNAHKHGADHTALLHLDYRPAGLEITVTNTVAAQPRVGSAAADTAAGAGHGLLGARERVGSVAGRLTATRGPGPVFRFTAWLPTDPADIMTPAGADAPVPREPADPRPNGAS
ncbi:MULTISPECIES: sensor histidine kinase [unclassified Cryobacterium]|uniref:sensor histidine kinase n=1 Tax=unclassified Cryobacterium TaxID=2649013 RepID=UPI00106BA19F|nr:MULTISPECIES: histidine kinase [unclassified Cryobacterium]TFC59669.1 two-component sensor histidine kinase [Cryobacterium sp. TMB3-1-2]TFC68132.1 two-component sensor histidine kinase [Cryobacterium sp. TMB3-15]TFC79256.1 two-component sensor histidine kinase [Cryobacterium sp. TMB3-10]TFD40202.1 two-component sensor histidine kinase [Cryobacterium sp. TMB3-12]